MITDSQGSIKNNNHSTPLGTMDSDDEAPMVVIRGADGIEVSRAEKDESSGKGMSRGMLAFILFDGVIVFFMLMYFIASGP